MNDKINEAALIGSKIHPILSDIIVTSSELTIVDDSESLIKLAVDLIKQTPVEHNLENEWSGNFCIEIDVKKELQLYLDGVYYQYGEGELTSISVSVYSCYFLNDGVETEVKYEAGSIHVKTSNYTFRKLIEDSVVL